MSWDLHDSMKYVQYSWTLFSLRGDISFAENGTMMVFHFRLAQSATP